MDAALATSASLDQLSDLFAIHLPSWGDPILLQTWHHSEEEIRTSFSWPKHKDDLENEDECLPMMISDPFMDAEMVSLLRGTLDTDESEDLEYDGDDSCSMCRDDDDSFDGRCYGEESRCSLDDESTPGSRSASSMLSTISIDVEDMDYAIEKETLCPGVERTPQDVVEWTVEVCRNGNFLCFKLRAHSGAYMELMVDEIIGSLEAILEDTVDMLIFRVQGMNKKNILVNSSLIIPFFSRILASHPKTTTSALKEINCIEQTEEATIDHVRVSSPRQHLRWPRLSRRKPKNRVAQKRQSRTSPTWKSLSARGKIRPRPSARVE